MTQRDLRRMEPLGYIALVRPRPSDLNEGASVNTGRFNLRDTGYNPWASDSEVK
jgi:hypothetical protein